MLSALLSLSARAGLYQYTFNDSGPIPQGGSVFSVEHTISGIEHVISSVELILTFNDKTSLTGDNTGIQGLLNLGTGAGATSVGFFPDVTRTSQGNRIYDVTFAGFNGLDPNNTWGLVLWDNSTSGVENGLVSWSLDITAVPEPVTMALAVFGALAAIIKLISWRRLAPLLPHETTRNIEGLSNRIRVVRFRRASLLLRGGFCQPLSSSLRGQVVNVGLDRVKDV